MTPHGNASLIGGVDERFRTSTSVNDIVSEVDVSLLIYSLFNRHCYCFKRHLLTTLHDLSDSIQYLHIWVCSSFLAPHFHPIIHFSLITYVRSFIE